VYRYFRSRPFAAAGNGGLILLIGAALACRASGQKARDRELEHAVGITAFSDWRCTPEGPRRLAAGFRRGERCLAERRDSDLLTTALVERDPFGHLMVAIRNWGMSDSAQWAGLKDSVLATFADRTRAAAICPIGLDTTGLTESPTRHEIRMWRLPEYDLSISSSITRLAPRMLLQFKVEAYVRGLVMCRREWRSAA
jgi:hypothetical protein